MSADTLDLPRLSQFCAVPQTDLQDALTSPTPDLVRVLLTQLSSKAQEWLQITAERVQQDVENEAAVHAQSLEIQSLTTQVTSERHNVESLTAQLKEKEDARQSHEEQVASSAAHTLALRNEISELKLSSEELATSNRTTLAVLDSKSKAFDQVSSELSSIHKKVLTLRSANSQLEAALETSQASLSNSTFREDASKRTCLQLQKNNDFLDAELKIKTTELLEIRKEKNRQIFEYTNRQQDDESKIEALQANEKRLTKLLQETTEISNSRSQKLLDLESATAEKTQAFQVEIEDLSRLASLSQVHLDHEKSRVEHLSKQLEDITKNSIESAASMSAELESYRSRAQQDHGEVSSLEQTSNNVLSPFERSTAPNHVHSSPSTTSPTVPANNLACQTANMITRTELIKENTRLATYNAELKATIDDFVHDLEIREPEIQELRSRNANLESQISEMAKIMEFENAQLDNSRNELSRITAVNTSQMAELELLRQQARDSSSQIKSLLIKDHLKGQAQDQNMPIDAAFIDRLAHDALTFDMDETDSDTANYITTNLVAFKNITEVVDQNQKLLRITRELGARMENEELLRRESNEARISGQNSEIKSLQDHLDEIRHLRAQSDIYIQERDMFRSMLRFRDVRSGKDNTDFEQNPDLSQLPQSKLTTRETELQKELTTLAEKLENVTNDYKKYKFESEKNFQIASEQRHASNNESAKLQSEVSRCQSQLSLGVERSELLQAHLESTRSENVELQKRLQLLSKTNADQGYKVQKTVEDLIILKADLDTVRGECVDLRAEKTFWKTVENRLCTEKEEMINERARLNALNANLQSLLNERELSEKEMRRSMQSENQELRIREQQLSNDLSAVRTEYSQAQDRQYHALAESDKHAHDLELCLGVLKEKMSNSEATCRRLDSELRLAQEKLQQLQFNMHPAPATSLLDKDTHEPSSGPSENNTAEHLRRENSRLKASVVVLQNQVEKYQSITKSLEEELGQVSEAQKAFEVEANRMIDDRETQLKTLQDLVAKQSEDHANDQALLQSARDEHDAYKHTREQAQKTLDAELATLKTNLDDANQSIQSYQFDLKEQARIARDVQNQYEDGLARHAAADEDLRNIRLELEKSHSELVLLRNEAQSCQTKLDDRNKSSAALEAALRDEARDVRQSAIDLRKQNELLHDQLALLASRGRNLTAGSVAKVETNVADAGHFLEIIEYLRKEKEISEMQLAIAHKEAKRLRQQLDLTTSELDTARIKVERVSHDETDREQIALDHGILLATVKDLNSHRETNAILRAEHHKAQAHAESLAGELQVLQNKVHPLEENCRALEALRDTQISKIETLQANVTDWQQRTQSLLQKYDHMDLGAFEELQNESRNMRVEYDNAKHTVSELKSECENLHRQISDAQAQTAEQLQAQRARLTEQFKSRSKVLSDRIKEKEAALANSSHLYQDSQNRVKELEHQLQDSQNRVQELEHQPQDVKSDKSDLLDRLQAAKDSDEAREKEPPEDAETSGSGSKSQNEAAWNSKVAELEASKIEADQKVVMLTQKINELVNRETQQKSGDSHESSEGAAIAAIEGKPTSTPLSTANDPISRSLRPSISSEILEAPESSENTDLGSLERSPIVITIEYVDFQQDHDSVKAQIDIHLRALRAELQRRYVESLHLNSENFKRRLDKMKLQLSQKLLDSRKDIQQKSENEHEVALQMAAAKHDEVVRDLENKYKEEIRLIREQIQPQEADSELKTKLDDKSWQPTEQEAKVMIQTYAAFKTVLRKNIIGHVNKAKSEISATMTAKHEIALRERLAESETIAKTAKDHAVMMETKKTALQLNMASNKARNLQHKIDLVSSAAQDSPEEAIGIVWARLKDIRPNPPAKTIPQDAAQVPKVVDSQPSSNLASVSSGPTVSSKPQDIEPRYSEDEKHVKNETSLDPSHSLPADSSIPRRKASTSTAPTSRAGNARGTSRSVSSIPRAVGSAASGKTFQSSDFDQGESVQGSTSPGNQKRLRAEAFPNDKVDSTGKKAKSSE